MMGHQPSLRGRWAILVHLAYITHGKRGLLRSKPWAKTVVQCCLLSSLNFKGEYGVHNRSPTVHVDNLSGNEARFLHAQ